MSIRLALFSLCLVTAVGAGAQKSVSDRVTIGEGWSFATRGVRSNKVGEAPPTYKLIFELDGSTGVASYISVAATKANIKKVRQEYETQFKTGFSQRKSSEKKFGAVLVWRNTGEVTGKAKRRLTTYVLFGKTVLEVNFAHSRTTEPTRGQIAFLTDIVSHYGQK